MREIKVGLIGFGTVGSGVGRILQKNSTLIEKPKGTMFVWGEIPKAFKKMGSIDFSKLLLREGKVAVSPGIGFGQYGEGFVRFALVENEPRIKQAVKGIQKVLKGSF